MKNALLLIIAALLISCGRKTIHKTSQVENPFDNSANEARFTDLESRLTTLELSVAGNIAAMSTLSSTLVNHASSLSALQDDLDQTDIGLVAEVQARINSYAALLDTINGLQTVVNNQIVQIVTLQQQENIVEYIDPCSDGPGYDEVLLKTSSGRVLAYFESGNNRHLTILEPNTAYQTTDSQHCNFSVSITGQLIY